MNGNRHLEAHYVNSGFPYMDNGGFMDFFQGFTHMNANFPNGEPMNDQESQYWSMNMHSYKFGMSGSGYLSYYDPYDGANHLPRADASERVWEYPSTSNVEEHVTSDSRSGEDDANDTHSVPEECIPSRRNSSDSQVLWQDNIDPDNMTYEELLDLGEAVGMESRGLSQELISLLPTSKYKSSGFFSRKKSDERCVVCQMRYKRGDQQITLPCKHLYHNKCITKWLTINKICPICNIEVFGEDSRH